MAVRVIDPLEVIEIDRQQGELVSAARRPGNLARQCLIEAAPVETAGERIGEHHARELCAHSVVRQPHARDRIGAPVGRRIVLPRKIALLGMLEQPNDRAQAAADVGGLQDDESDGCRAHDKCPDLFRNVHPQAERDGRGDERDVAGDSELYDPPGLPAAEEEVGDVHDDDCPEERPLVVVGGRRGESEKKEKEQVAEQGGRHEPRLGAGTAVHNHREDADEDDVGHDRREDTCDGAIESRRKVAMQQAQLEHGENERGQNARTPVRDEHFASVYRAALVIQGSTVTPSRSVAARHIDRGVVALKVAVHILSN